jgi:histidinol-phosphatase
VGFEKELLEARAAAVQAATAIRRVRESGFAVESKKDQSPVTAADRESEAVITRILSDTFPNDGVLGEEGALRESKNGRRWIVDPIDGTRDFVRGNPFWGILIGLEQEGEVVAGVVHLPDMRQMYYGARGMGAWRNEERIRVSGIGSRREAVLCFQQINNVTGMPFAPRLLDWCRGFWAMRSFGGVLDSMMVASGQAEVWIEPRVAPWDLAAPRIILEEAGARFFNLDGGSSIYGGTAAACVPGMEEEVWRFFCGNEEEES